jgi:hypothetical protein
MPIIPIMIQDHKVWVYVDSGATFSMVGAAEAGDMGINWQSGRRQMVVVGDGSYIPTFIHKIPIQLGASQITVPIGFWSALESVLTFSAARECLTNLRSASTIASVRSPFNNSRLTLSEPPQSVIHS